MVQIRFCETGRYVMVRLSCGEPVREQAEWQMTRGEWQEFLQLLKPSRSLDVIEVPLERWR